MALSIILGENELRAMPPELRKGLLAWYFERPATILVDPRPQPQSETDHEIPSVIDDLRRITFPDLVKAGLLRTGEMLRCRPLKRQKRTGIEAFITGATVAKDGSVIYGDKKYVAPSTLAKAMLNANGGKAPATNGYDYLFVESPKGLMPLKELRKKLSADTNGDI